jgi:hypothetical protein
MISLKQQRDISVSNDCEATFYEFGQTLWATIGYWLDVLGLPLKNIFLGLYFSLEKTHPVIAMFG